MATAVQIGVSVLSLGGLYALLALGLALVFSVLGLANFAYGELIMITGYSVVLFTAAGVPLAVTVVVTIPVVAAASMLMERVAFRPVRGAGPATLLVTSFAVSVILQNLASLFISPRPRGLPVPAALGQVLVLGPVRIPPLELLTAVISLGLLAGLTAFLTRTTAGIELRAAAEDFDMARLLGVRANRVVLSAFALSGVLASVAGLLWLARTANIAPQSGFTPLLIAFVASVVGGLGNLKGAVVGGFLLGTLTVGLQAALPSDLLSFRRAFEFGIVILILLARPGGLVASRRAESL